MRAQCKVERGFFVITTDITVEKFASNINRTRNHGRSVEERCELSNRLSAASDLTLIYLSYDEVATLAGTNARKIEALCQAGEGPRVTRLGYRTVRFNAADVIQWLQKK
jgi:excisionase family DNA binding protein